MKKQILFLMLFVLALFAGTKSYGQDKDYLTGDATCVTPTPLTCASSADALHPLPGKNYTYTVTTTPAAIATVHWFVTDASTVLTAIGTLTATKDIINGKYVLNSTAAYNDPANTAKTIDISWKSFDGATNKVLLVAYVTGASGCSDNIEVFRIEPTFGFTLDIAGLLDNGTSGAVECVSQVVSATYDGTNLKMDYGANYVFFSVNAANYVDSWLPSFTAAVTGGSTVGAVEWAYPAQAKLAAGPWNAATVPVAAQAASKAVDNNGECIVLRVKVTHAATENDAVAGPPVVTVGVNGVMFDPAALPAAAYTNAILRDLDNPASTGACVQDKTDEATYTLTPRPAIVESAPVAPAFEPKN